METKVYYWYNGNDRRVIYDIVIHVGDYEQNRRARLAQLKQYRELSGMGHMVYTTGKMPVD